MNRQFRYNLIQSLKQKQKELRRERFPALLDGAGGFVEEQRRKGKEVI